MNVYEGEEFILFTKDEEDLFRVKAIPFNVNEKGSLYKLIYNHLKRRSFNIKRMKTKKSYQRREVRKGGQIIKADKEEEWCIQGKRGGKKRKNNSNTMKETGNEIVQKKIKKNEAKQRSKRYITRE